MLNTFDFHWRAASVLWLLTLWCCISLNHTDAQKYYVSTPTSATVCDGDVATLTCNISQAGGLAALFRIFTTFNTSGPLVASLNSGDNSPPYNYPEVQPGDNVARLEVMANPSINGYHFQCRLSLRPPVDSPGTGIITVIRIPSCPTHVKLDDSFLPDNGCNVSLIWQQPPNTHPVTSTTVTYCPTSSPNCGNSMTCTSPCTISGLDPGTEYQFTVIPNNNCGSATGCTWNNATHIICFPDTTPTTGSTPQPTASIGLVIGVVIAIVLLAILICCFCLGVKVCKSASDGKNKPPREEQPHIAYAIPIIVRDNKEMIEENGITYAALEFSEVAGGGGKNDIHCTKELDNVQYSEVVRLQV